jgi:hypothetical protein
LASGCAINQSVGSVGDSYDNALAEWFSLDYLIEDIAFERALPFRQMALAPELLGNPGVRYSSK